MGAHFRVEEAVGLLPRRACGPPKRRAALALSRLKTHACAPFARARGARQVKFGTCGVAMPGETYGLQYFPPNGLPLPIPTLTPDPKRPGCFTLLVGCLRRVGLALPPLGEGSSMIGRSQGHTVDCMLLHPFCQPLTSNPNPRPLPPCSSDWQGNVRQPDRRYLRGAPG